MVGMPQRYNYVSARPPSAPSQGRRVLCDTQASTYSDAQKPRRVDQESRRSLLFDNRDDTTGSFTMIGVTPSTQLLKLDDVPASAFHRPAAQHLSSSRSGRGTDRSFTSNVGAPFSLDNRAFVASAGRELLERMSRETYADAYGCADGCVHVTGVNLVPGTREYHTWVMTFVQGA